MTPKPWSFSALDDFINCPRAFEAKKVSKSVVEDRSGAELIWGEWVHKQFENRLKDGVVLPIDLQQHEGYLAKLEREPGTLLAETKIALNRKLEPCGFFDKDVWYRGVIDAGKVDEETAHLIDHKTGKKHKKFQQLKSFALWGFAKFPKVDRIIAEFYWCQDQSTTGEVYIRDQIPALWASFVPDLRQYAEAFRDNIWQPRQSGLCNGWCPVTECEYWKPKRNRG